jgi:tRNA threonylcarbamoyladenosine biosynthesis protein TsaE
MRFKTNNPEATRDIGKKMALNFLESEKNRKSALVINLRGDLGAGKTTFTQGFAQALGVENWIKSPTFVLMREYAIFSPQFIKNSFRFLYHIDCYRIDEDSALLEIGIKEIMLDPGNIVLIEWGEKIKKLLPENTIKINLRHLQEDKREITVN